MRALPFRDRQERLLSGRLRPLIPALGLLLTRAQGPCTHACSPARPGLPLCRLRATFSEEHPAPLPPCSPPLQRSAGQGGVPLPFLEPRVQSSPSRATAEPCLSPDVQEAAPVAPRREGALVHLASWLAPGTARSLHRTGQHGVRRVGRGWQSLGNRKVKSGVGGKDPAGPPGANPGARWAQKPRTPSPGPHSDVQGGAGGGAGPGLPVSLPPPPPGPEAALRPLLPPLCAAWQAAPGSGPGGGSWSGHSHLAARSVRRSCPRRPGPQAPPPDPCGGSPSGPAVGCVRTCFCLTLDLKWTLCSASSSFS